MPGLSRFSRKQPLSQESNTTASTTGGKDGTAPAGNGDGGASQPAVPTNGGGGNAEQSNDGGDNVANFSTSLEDRPSTGGSNTFADFGNMFTMDEHNGVNSNMMLDSTFLSSNPTEGGMGEGGLSMNNNMMGDNSFMQGFGSRPSTGEGGNAFQFGGMMNGFDSEGGDAVEQQPTTANGGNETNGAEAKRPADAPSGGGGIGGGIGIGLFAKRRAVPAASSAVAPDVSRQPEIAKTNQSPPKNDGLTSTASSVANLSQFDTNLLSENKNENEISSSGNIQIPKSIATSGGDVDDDLTVGTTTSVAAAAMSAPPAPALPAKSPYFSGAAGAVNQSDAQHSSNAMPESSPNKEEIIIPGMNASAEEKSGENTNTDVAAETTKQGGVLASNSSSSQRVSLSPPGAKVNQATSIVNENSIVIPGVVTNNDNVNVNVAQTLMQLGGATKGKSPPTAASAGKTPPNAASAASTTQRANGAFTSSSVLGNSSRGMGRFNSTEKVKFALPESTTKTFATKSTANMNLANTTAITPDHRNGAKKASSTPFVRPSTSIGKNQQNAGVQQNAVTPIPHKTVQHDSASRVIPAMPAAEKHVNTSNETTRTDEELQHRNDAMAMGNNSVRSPTPAMKNDVTTPKASNLNNNGGGYSGSSMLTTHESFDELLSQLGGDLTDATDIHNKGNLDLLHLEVALTHAYAKSLHFKGQYVDLVDEIDAFSSMGEMLLEG
eukprot:scaffold10708_cov157-Skeletonema_dohrnii-CCMP3373.AAC.4